MTLPAASRVGLSVVLLLFGTASAHANKRALLVGIDKYVSDNAAPTVAVSDKASAPKRGRRFGNLAGAVADATAMRDLLKGKYGFTDDEIVMLTDAKATHAAILGSIDEFLGKDLHAGDVRLFYYAGHGSEVRNSKSKEWDKLDETLVPVDALTAGDIRDKQLGWALDHLMKGGAQLTVILDSCHSQSATRGAPTRVRAADIDEHDVADASPPPPPVEKKGALVLSAAADYQPAGEMEDAKGNSHGAFTDALVQALWNFPTDAPIGDVFESARAVMKQEGRPQEPALQANDERKHRSLFGVTPGSTDGTAKIPVVHVFDTGNVELGGGAAQGLTKGSELVVLDGNKRRDDVRVRIEEVRGMSESRGTLTAGKPDDVKAGMLLVLDRWAPADEPALRVFVPEATLSEERSKELAAALAPLRDDARFVWVTDPAAQPPTHTVSWDGKRWLLSTATGLSEPLAATTTAALADQILSVWHPQPRHKGEPLDKPVLFLDLPPTPQLAAAIRGGDAVKTGRVELAHSALAAQYRLQGRTSDGPIEYAWVMVGPSSAVGRTLAMPPSTTWTTNAPTAGNALADAAGRLGRIRAWFKLKTPTSSTVSFPYQLALRKEGTKKLLTDGTLRAGEKYEFVLHADGKALKKLKGRWYVYVFLIDSSGAGQVFFPAQGEENYLPPEDSKPATEYVLPGGGITIDEPFGVDTYNLLVSATRINTQSLTWDAVRGPEKKRDGSELGRLLSNVGTRGASSSAPTTWSIQHIPFTSVR